MRVLSLGTGKIDYDLPKRLSCTWVNFEESEGGPLAKLGVPQEVYRRNCARQYPRYIEFENFTSVILFETATERKSGLHIYVFSDRIVTVNARHVMEDFRQNFFLEKRRGPASVGDCMLALVSFIFAANSKVLMKYEEETSRIEEAISGGGRLDIHHIFSLKRSINSLSKRLWRGREIVFDMMYDRMKFLELSKDEKIRMDEIFNSLLFDIHSSELLREILTDSVDVYHTILSNRINDTIRRLTVVTVVLTIIATISMVPNTIATIFGIPYFPLKADDVIFQVFGLSIMPWELILLLIFFFSVVPAAWLFLWWQGFKKESDQAQK
jgi:Mg2+ and Co2+ transporter CorA